MRHCQLLGGGSYSVNKLVCFDNIHFLFGKNIELQEILLNEGIVSQTVMLAIPGIS